MPDSIIPLVSDATAASDARQLFAELRGKLGFVPNLVRLWAHSSLLLRPLTTLEVTVGAAGRVPAALKELAAARVSELNRCPYCRSFHHARLRELDVEGDKAARLAAPELPEGLFSAEEQLVLRLADEMTLDVRAAPETVMRVRERFGSEGAIELMAIVAMLNADNRMALSADLVADEWPR